MGTEMTGDKVSFTREDVEVVSETSLHQGFVSLSSYALRHRLFAGGMSPLIHREVLLRNRAAGLLAYDPLKQAVVLVEQFRIGAYVRGNEPWALELVAGMEEPGESLEMLVKREAVEEAGIHIPGKLIKICDYMASTGGSSEQMSLYCGKVDADTAAGIHGLAEEGEDIRVHVLSLTEAFAALRNGRIQNAATIIALQWLEINRESIFCE